MKIGVFVLLIVVLTGGVCFGIPVEDVELLWGRDYFPSVLEVIMGAKEEVFVVMYAIGYKKDDLLSPVNELLKALVDAKQRGVKVRVILELARWEDRAKSISNWDAYSYLKGCGIDVVFDTGGLVTHSKLVVVDNKIVVLGSSNWTKSAILRNNEVNAKVVSSEFAREVARYASKVKTQYLDETSGNVIWIPYELVVRDGVFPYMVRTHDRRAMDLYLYLLYLYKDFKEGEEIEGGFEELAKYLEIYGIMNRTEYRRQIVKVMRKLDRRYEVIYFDYKHSKGYKIRFREDREDCFPIPFEYWEYGWDKVLDMAGKFCLLLNLSERGRINGEYAWEGAREFISKKYGVSVDIFTKGMRLLERYDVVDIEYARFSKDGAHIGPTIYRFKGLYDLNEARLEMEELEREYGGVFNKAKEYTLVLNKDFSVDYIKRIIGLIQEYGMDMVDKAIRKLLTMRKDNPKRSLGYLIGILRTKREIDVPG